MKKYPTILLAALMALALIFGIQYAKDHVSYAAGDVINLSLDPSVAGKYEYLTNQEALVNVDLDLSGFDTNIINPTLVITVPSDYLGSLIGSQIATAAGPPVLSTQGGMTKLTYSFSQLTGGTTLRIPLKIRSKAFDTPNNYALPISATLMSSTGSVLAQSTDLKLVQKVIAPIIIKSRSIAGQNYYTDGSVGFGGVASQGNPNIIDSTGAVNQVFSNYFTFPANQGATVNTSEGMRRYSQVIFTDILPQDAVFSQDDNPGWTYDPAIRQAKYAWNNPITWNYTTGMYNNSYIPPLKLKFPGGDIRTNYVNQMSVEFVPANRQDYEGANAVSADGISFKLTTSLPTLSVTKSQTSGFYILDCDPEKKKSIDWVIISKNMSSDYPMENIVLEDYNLDPRLKYSSIKIYGNWSPTLSGTLRFEAVDASGNVTLIADNVPIASKNAYPIPDGTIKVRASSTSGSKLGSACVFGLTISAVFKDPDNTHPVGTSDLMNNSIRGSGSYVGIQGTYSTNGGTYVIFTPYTPKAYLQKTIVSGGSNYFVGDAVTFQLRAVSDVQNRIAPGDTLDVQEVVDLLPSGLSYTPGSARYTNESYAIINNNILESTEPEVVLNYKGSGRTALIWKFKAPYTGSDGANFYFNIRFDAKVMKEAKEGSNTNQGCLIWSNNGSNPSPSQQVGIKDPFATYGAADSLDIDGDGNLSEQMAVGSTTFTYVPPREVIASKEVKGSSDTAFMLTGGRSEMDSDAAYNLKVWNHSIVDVQRLTLLDVLPYIGDKGIVPDASGNFGNRNSQYAVKLTGPVPDVPGYTIWYTDQLPGGNTLTSPSNYAAADIWKPADQISDWSVVRGVKITMDAGSLLKIDETVNFRLPIKTPAADAALVGKVANNSFAVSQNGRDYLEATTSALNLIGYKISGIAFEDSNENGVCDPDEPLMKDILAGMLNADGTPALDPWGNPYHAKTGANGNYEFLVYHQGSYMVEMEPPAIHKITIQVGADQASGSHINTDTHQTDVFTLTPNQSTLVRNGGFAYAAGDLRIDKKVTDYSGITKNEGEGPFDFEIRLDGQLYQGKAEINGRTVDIVNGRISFKSGDEVYLRDIPENTAYAVREINGDDYIVNGGVSIQTGTIVAKQTADATFINQEKSVGKLTILKTVYPADPTPPRTAPIGPIKARFGSLFADAPSFIIKVTGPSFPDGRAMTIKAGTPLVLTDLIYGRYEVEEIGAEDYIVGISAPVTLDAQNKEGTIYVNNTEQALGKLTIYKKVFPAELESNIDTTTRSIKNEQGRLFADEPSFTIRLTGPSYPYGQEMSIKAGTPLVLTDLVYGEYRVEELGAEDYTVNISGPVTLDVQSKEGAIFIANTEKPLGQLTIHKTVYPADNIPVKDSATRGVKDWRGGLFATEPVFTLKVTGPSYPDGQEMGITAGTPLVLTDLIYGEYKVEELGAEDYAMGVSGPVTLDIQNKQGTIFVANTEKPLGKLTVKKELKDAAGNPLDATRSFAIKVTGPSFPDGQEMGVTAGTPLVLTDLIYGEYKVDELGADDYNASISDPVTLNVQNKEGTITVTNTEKALGRLIITKVLQDKDGNVVKDPENFIIKVTGPSYPDGKEFNITNGKPLELTGLIFGSYTASEPKPGAHKVSISGEANLTNHQKDGQIVVINTRLQGGEWPYDDHNAKTGDPSNLAIWLVLAGLGIAGGAGMAAASRKRRHNGENE